MSFNLDPSKQATEFRFSKKSNVIDQPGMFLINKLFIKHRRDKTG